VAKRSNHHLNIRLFGKTFENPVWVASGTFGYGEEYAEIYDVGKLGAIVTKSVTLEPRQGHPPPRVVETPSGMLNAIGLQNVGVDAFVKEKLPYLRKLKTRVIVNIAGSNVDEYVEVARRLDRKRGIDALEVNISCPNVQAGGIEIGADPRLAMKTIRTVKKASSHPVIAKLSPNVTDITEIAKAVEDAGADAISLINTLVGMVIDTRTRRLALSNGTGGLSGPAIRPVAVAMVYKVAKAVDIPVIGIGGITNTDDALQFFLAGAKAVQVGTANFINPKAPLEIISGLRQYCRENRLGNVSQILDSFEG
jgi:dihydroorotate dehydrogenase (NAD+) catalytic subunit